MVVESIARDADSQGRLPVRREGIVRLTEQGGLFVRGPLVNGIAVYAVDQPLAEGIFYRQPVSGQGEGRQQRVYDVLIRIQPGILVQSADHPLQLAVTLGRLQSDLLSERVLADMEQ